MVNIRQFSKQDSVQVGRLIADTYTEFNLNSIPKESLPLYLGPFAYAYSLVECHQENIADTIRADMVFVALIDDDIIGVLRGRVDKLQSLFVKKAYQRQGIGRQLVQVYEKKCIIQGSTAIKVQATLFAVPFYLRIGYKRTTGIRLMRSFQGHGLPYQPMKKTFHYELE